MNARSLRAVRGFAAAGIATLLAAVSHTIGGGDAPPAAVIVSMVLLSAPIATALVGRRLNPARVLIAVLLSQIAFHAAFSLVGGRSAAAASSMMHDHDAMTVPLLEQAVAVPPSSLMLTAHVLAALLSTVLLYRGERAIRSLLVLVIDRLAARTRGIAPHERRLRRAPASTSLRRPRLALLSDAIARRGPPPVSLLP